MKIVYILFILTTLALFSENRAFADLSKSRSTKDAKSCDVKFASLVSEAHEHFSQRRFLLAAIGFSNSAMTTCNINQFAESKLGYADSIFQLGEVKAAKSEWEALTIKSEIPEKYKTMAQLQLLFYFDQSFQSTRPELNGIISMWTLRDDRNEFKKHIEISNLNPETKSELMNLNLVSQNPSSPLVAGLASAIIPGAGQVYVGEYQTAAISFVLNSLFLLSTIELSKKDLGFTAALSGIAFSTVYLGNIISAVNGAKALNKKILENRNQQLQNQLRKISVQAF